MEPERPIEKLLRACAIKRRGGADVPSEMHPATRRMLQAEVRRQFGSKQERVSPRWWSALFAPAKLSWAVATCAVLLVVLGSVFFLPRHKPNVDLLAKNEPPSAPARDLDQVKRLVSSADKETTLAPAQISRVSTSEHQLAAAPPAVAAPRPVAAPGQPAPAKSRDEMAARYGLAKDAAVFNEESKLKAEAFAYNQPTSALASNAAGKAGVMTTDASSVISEPAPVGSSLAAAAPTTAPAAGSAAAPPPGSAPTSLALKAGDSPLIPRLDSIRPAPAPATDALFSNLARAQAVASPAQGLFRTAVRPSNALSDSAAANAILTSFKLEQTGSQLRIIDNDGSVYIGSLLSAPAGGSLGGVASEAVSQEANRRRGLRSAQTQAAAPGSIQLLSPMSFRVTGTNITLNQKVVFTGNIAALTNSIAGRSLPTLLNSRISGKAQVNGRQQIEINAVPAKP